MLNSFPHAVSIAKSVLLFLDTNEWEEKKASVHWLSIGQQECSFIKKKCSSWLKMKLIIVLNVMIFPCDALKVLDKCYREDYQISLT